MKLNILCSLKNVKSILCVLFVTSALAVISHVTETKSEQGLTPSTRHCSFTPAYFKIYSCIENSLYIYIPMIIVVGCNIAIIIIMKQSSVQRTAFTTNSDILSRRNKEQKQMTRLLMIISCVFILLHCTQLLAKIWQSLYPDPGIILTRSARNFFIFYACVALGYQITDFQNSVNFFVYCAFGTKVRRLFIQTFCFSCTYKSPLFDRKSVTSVTTVPQ